MGEKCDFRKLTCVWEGTSNTGGKETPNIVSDTQITEQASVASRAVIPASLHGADVQVHCKDSLPALYVFRFCNASHVYGRLVCGRESSRGRCSGGAGAVRATLVIGRGGVHVTPKRPIQIPLKTSLFYTYSFIFVYIGGGG